MARLFVAIDIPSDIRYALQHCQPASLPGVRNSAPDQLHLTLHFLGDRPIQPVVESLQSVHFRVRPFQLKIAGVGSFAVQHRSTVLWAGVQTNDDLKDLHRSVGEALSRVGFQPESRPFTPHITMARCEPRVPKQAVQLFLTTHAELSLPPVQVNSFALYSSILTQAGPRYERQLLVPLRS